MDDTQNNDDKAAEVEEDVVVADDDSTGDIPEVEGSSAITEEPSTDVSHEDPDMFPRKVVEDLRRENAKYRSRAKDRDDLARELFTARVAALGRLQDPTDLPYDDGLLADRDAMIQAVDELIHAKPHLASRAPHGTVGQGVRGGIGGVDLAGLLRAAAH